MAFSTHDIVPDSPTNNFATLNVLDTKYGAGSFSDGNLKGETTSAGVGRFTSAIRPITGKYYCEFYIVTVNRFSVGIENSKKIGSGQSGIDENSIILIYSGQGFYNSTIYSNYSASLANGNVIGVVLDLDNKNIFISINGTYANSATLTEIENGTTTHSFNAYCSVAQNTLFDGNIGIFFEDNSASDFTSAVANFGQDPTFGGNKNTPATVNGVTGPFAPSGDAAGTAGLFYYPPPAGFKSLCTANLPDFTPTVTGDTPQEYFKAVTYTGNVPANNTTGSQNVDLGILADLIWIKDRNSGTNQNHGLFDSVRGFDKWIGSNTTSAQDATANAYLSYVSGTTYNIGWSPSINSNTHLKIAWCWKAGGAPDLTSSPTKPFAKNGVQYETLSAANITAGTITPTAMSVNTDAGFSIVKYTGTGSSADLPHGLTKTPEFIVIKNTQAANSWAVYHVSIGPQQQILLNDSGAASSDSNGFDATPTTNYVNLGSGASMDTNQTGTHIMYCWHSVEGYSKFGSYTGNGSTDGPFVYCGFRPAWVMIKEVASSNNWSITDSVRNPYNPVDQWLNPNLSSTTYTYTTGDYTSLGFKLRNTGTGTNSSNTYIFMAFAEQPFKFSNAR